MEIQMALHLPRDTVSVPVGRQVLDSCLETLGVTADTRADIALALGEACANVIQHAGPGEEYEVQVSSQGLPLHDRGRQHRHRRRQAGACRRRRRAGPPDRRARPGPADHRRGGRQPAADGQRTPGDDRPLRKDPGVDTGGGLATPVQCSRRRRRSGRPGRLSLNGALARWQRLGCNLRVPGADGKPMDPLQRLSCDTGITDAWKFRPF